MPDILNGKDYHVLNGDCIEHILMRDMPEESVDFSVFSPPFPSTFAYTSLPNDLGNSEDLHREGKLHFSFFFKAMRRVMKPGRVMAVHCAQIARLKRSGESGLYDFRGLLIRLAVRAGFTYEYDWCVRKNPQAQAIRTKKWELKFQGLETDRAMSRGTLCDYILKFRAPGENKKKINTEGEVTRNDWILLAEGGWLEHVIETDTLNASVRGAKSEDDVKHICPLQLRIIEDLIRLYTDPGEIVFSPFAGIGSEGFVALGGKSPKTKRQLHNARRFYGVELKDEYHTECLRNLAKAKRQFNEAGQLPLFDDWNAGKAAEYGANVCPGAEVVDAKGATDV